MIKAILSKNNSRSILRFLCCKPLECYLINIRISFLSHAHNGCIWNWGFSSVKLYPRMFPLYLLVFSTWRSFNCWTNVSRLRLYPRRSRDNTHLVTRLSIRSEKSPLLWMAVLYVYESTVASLGPDAKLNGCCSFLDQQREANRTREADGNLDLMRTPLKVTWTLVQAFPPFFLFLWYWGLVHAGTELHFWPRSEHMGIIRE